MDRLKDWETRFDRFLNEYSKKEFGWGTADCCIFACDAVEALSGINPYPYFPADYNSEEEAVKAVKGFAYLDEFGDALIATVELMSEYFGLEEIEPGYLKKGDIVLAHAQPLNQPVCGVYVGTGKIAFMSKNGLIYVKKERFKIYKGFRV